MNEVRARHLLKRRSKGGQRVRLWPIATFRLSAEFRRRSGRGPDCCLDPIANDP
jgi:hypothetical protein